MAPFTHNVKKIKGAVHKNVDIDATCKQAFRPIARLPIDVGGGEDVTQVNKFEKGRSGHRGTAKNRLIDTTENIAFPQLRLRAVITMHVGIEVKLYIVCVQFPTTTLFD